MEEQLRILKMVEDGKITAEQAASLLAALGGALPATSYEVLPKNDSYDKKMFRIQVNSLTGDNVNIQLPVKAIKKLLKATGKIPIVSEEMQGVDLQEIMNAVVECLDEQVTGDIINVTAADGTTVKIFID